MRFKLARINYALQKLDVPLFRLGSSRSFNSSTHHLMVNRDWKVRQCESFEGVRCSAWVKRTRARYWLSAGEVEIARHLLRSLLAETRGAHGATASESLRITPLFSRMCRALVLATSLWWSCLLGYLKLPMRRWLHLLRLGRIACYVQMLLNWSITYKNVDVSACCLWLQYGL